MVIVFANKFSFGIKSNNVAKGGLSKPPFFLSFFCFAERFFLYGVKKTERAKVSDAFRCVSLQVQQAFVCVW